MHVRDKQDLEMADVDPATSKPLRKIACNRHVAA